MREAGRGKGKAWRSGAAAAKWSKAEGGVRGVNGGEFSVHILRFVYLLKGYLGQACPPPSAGLRVSPSTHVDSLASLQ